jgi:hypothetical protein
MNRPMNRTCCLALALPVVFSTAALAQTPTSPTPPPASTQSDTQTPAQSYLPTDPAELLQLAANSNGLHGARAKPWHLHATWKSLDPSDHVADQGTFEEW